MASTPSSPGPLRENSRNSRQSLFPIRVCSRSSNLCPSVVQIPSPPWCPSSMVAVRQDRHTRRNSPRPIWKHLETALCRSAAFKPLQRPLFKHARQTRALLQTLPPQPSNHPTIHQSNHPSIHQSINPSIHQSINPPTPSSPPPARCGSSPVTFLICQRTTLKFVHSAFRPLLPQTPDPGRQTLAASLPRIPCGAFTPAIEAHILKKLIPPEGETPTFLKKV